MIATSDRIFPVRVTGRGLLWLVRLSYDRILMMRNEWRPDACGTGPPCSPDRLKPKGTSMVHCEPRRAPGQPGERRFIAPPPFRPASTIGSTRPKGGHS
jgi:hypothetical protein